jgi:hypothetical protein
LAAIKGWDLLKLDVGGTFLCAKIDEQEEVYMILGKTMSELCMKWLPDIQQ